MTKQVRRREATPPEAVHSALADTFDVPAHNHVIIVVYVSKTIYTYNSNKN